MRLEQLLYFREVAEKGSINKASAVLHMAQQSLSSNIRLLEEETGCTLLTRTNKGIRLTKEGRLFLRFAEATLEQYEVFQKQVNPQAFMPVSGELRIGAVYNVTTSYLPKFILSFQKRYEDVHLKVYKETLPNIIEELEEDKLDVGFIMRMTCSDKVIPEFPESLEFIPLTKCRSYLWVSNQSSLAGYRTLSQQKMTEQPLVICSDIDMAFLDMVYEDYDLKYFDFPLNTEIPMMAELVENNLAVCPDIRIGDLPPALNMFFKERACHAIPLRLPKQTKVTSGYIRRKDAVDDPLVVAFAAHCNHFFGLTTV